ncbi:DUF397 domain-containing protein [Streptomyces sp. NBC_00576]|uniref:DUF397 domain-containing protein n=1 Tax=Streptomyces sp. NBC_00576 TaxID=2903665 RepID=UPI002E8233EA|nr:DUF397 domain-containing protein [Streptomyces sp. NBC_00576]WUB72954.1 DUF397 domain-containing protein [Streptomyces sp. NBC_00576]
MSAHRDVCELDLESAWFKSSYSSDAGGSCVETATLTSAQVAVRDSKFPEGPALLLPPQAFAALLDHLRS